LLARRQGNWCLQGDLQSSDFEAHPAIATSSFPCQRHFVRSAPGPYQPLTACCVRTVCAIRFAAPSTARCPTAATRCAYTYAVIAIEAWPTSLETVLISAPPASEAAECRRPWKVSSGERLALLADPKIPRWKPSGSRRCTRPGSRSSLWSEQRRRRHTLLPVERHRESGRCGLAVQRTAAVIMFIMSCRSTGGLN
jgi:hypothetical protein